MGELDRKQRNHILEIKSGMLGGKGNEMRTKYRSLKMMRTNMHLQRLQMDKMFYDYDYSSCRELFDPTNLLVCRFLRCCSCEQSPCICSIFIMVKPLFFRLHLREMVDDLSFAEMTMPSILFAPSAMPFLCVCV